MKQPSKSRSTYRQEVNDELRKCLAMVRKTEGVVRQKLNEISSLRCCQAGLSQYRAAFNDHMTFAKKLQAILDKYYPDANKEKLEVLLSRVSDETLLTEEETIEARTAIS